MVINSIHTVAKFKHCGKHTLSPNFLGGSSGENEKMVEGKQKKGLFFRCEGIENRQFFEKNDHKIFSKKWSVK